MTHRSIHLCAVALLLVVSSIVSAQQSALDKALSVSAPQAIVDKPAISEVRQAVLKEIARSVGLRAGLLDEGKKIVSQITLRKSELDGDFHFGALVLPSGAFPPVIEEAKSVISVTDFSMRVSGVVYKITEPARMQSVPPTWRDYLYTGLNQTDDPLIGQAQNTAYPKNEAEAAYWKQIVLQAHAEGVKQAQKIFALNLARLERDFVGMRRFYELHARGLVTAPVVASATDAITRPDENTIIIGETLFKITKKAGFTDTDRSWKVTQ